MNYLIGIGWCWWDLAWYICLISDMVIEGKLVFNYSVWTMFGFREVIGMNMMMISEILTWYWLLMRFHLIYLFDQWYGYRGEIGI